MNRLKDLREEKDLKQKEVCKIINKSQVAYSQYETELYNISNNYLIKLAKFYNTSIDYILYRTDIRKSYIPIQNKKAMGNENMLKTLRKENKKTQKQIAKELNMPLKSYIKYENGETKINIQLLKTFADYYKTSTDYILYNTDNKKAHPKSLVDWKSNTKL